MEKPEDLVWYIIASSAFTALIVILFSVLIYRQFKLRLQQGEDFEKTLQQKEIEKINAIVIAQEDERAEIARNLHDDLGATLSIMQRKLASLANHEHVSAESEKELLQVSTMVDHSVTTLRSITNGMLPHYLLSFGLKKSVERLFEQAQGQLGKPCLLQYELPNSSILLKDQEIQMFYIISELINNTVKHADPSYMDGRFTQEHGHVLFSLSHDGVPMSQSDYENLQGKKEGMGLSSLAYRVHQLRAVLNFESLNRGGKVTVLVPIQSSPKKVQSKGE
jgi:signal transduction histidine kinase